MDNLTPKKFIIGTRGSLLALTQAGQAKAELEKITGHEFEFKVIKTQGDQVTDKALWQLEGKDFFTKELDRALIAKEIDMVIHSYKDLGSERPDQISLAAITKRQYPHDILLVKKATVEKLQKGWDKTKFIVGTSAPRRITNISSSLKKYLPQSFQSENQDYQVECKVLRGNVNSRIEKLRDDNYDAIVLALAGIERLALTSSSAKILKKLLEGITFKVLPFHNFPPAASQGSLAIEVHKDNRELFDLLQCVHHDQSALEISQERKTFNSYGGGCHLALGIHVKSWNDQLIEYKKGEVNQKQISQKQFITHQESSELKKTNELFLGFPPTMTQLISEYPDVLWDELSSKETIKLSKNIDQAYTEHLFITSSYCLEGLKELSQISNTSHPNDPSLWAAGQRTHKKLSQEGYWVHSDACSLGVEQVRELLESKAIQMMLGSLNTKSNTGLGVLTEVNSETQEQDLAIGCYKRQYNQASDNFLQKLKSKKVFYWTSTPQFEHYSNHYPELKTDANIKHYCGLGKTYSHLKKLIPTLKPIVSFKELLP